MGSYICHLHLIRLSIKCACVLLVSAGWSATIKAITWPFTSSCDSHFSAILFSSFISFDNAHILFMPYNQILIRCYRDQICWYFRTTQKLPKIAAFIFAMEWYAWRIPLFEVFLHLRNISWSHPMFMFGCCRFLWCNALTFKLRLHRMRWQRYAGYNGYKTSITNYTNTNIFSSPKYDINNNNSKTNTKKMEVTKTTTTFIVEIASNGKKMWQRETISIYL